MKYQSWKIKSRYPKDLLRDILASRKIKDCDNFVACQYEMLSATKTIHDLEKAKNIIITAIQKKKKIGIFMDYDADGISGGAIMFKALTKLKAEVVHHVPSRREGYGLNNDAVDAFSRQGVSLLITIDCGIKNINEIDHANSLGIDCIVVDHHEVGDEIPRSVANVHPHLSKKGAFAVYSGGGVAYMLASALLEQTGQEKWLLDLAAISTIADLVPLIDDNRIIVKYGLVVLNKTKNLGLKKLIEVSLIKPGTIGTYEVGYLIGPRINAAGRIKNPDDSFRLLTTDNIQEAQKLAENLNTTNQSRQEMLLKASKQAVEFVEKNNLNKNNIIVLKGDWNEGIVGLVASKIVEKFYRPTIVFSQAAEKYKGSARSIPGVDVTKLIGKSSRFLVNFGGHKQAAGLSLEAKKYEKFRKSILQDSVKIDKSIYQRVLKIDALIDPGELNIQLFGELEKLRPFGMGNPRPILAMENCFVESITEIGKDKSHRRITLRAKDNRHYAVLFDYPSGNWQINNGDTIDVAFSLNLNEWNGRKKLDLIIEDVKETK